MQKEEFLEIRKKLDKTQKQIALLLGISLKSVESYEQGVRNIPDNVAKILYFILFKLNMEKLQGRKPCWNKMKCSLDDRTDCATWLTKEGLFCWFLTGKACVRFQSSLPGMPVNCFYCRFFQDNLDLILQ